MTDFVDLEAVKAMLDSANKARVEAEAKAARLEGAQAELSVRLGHLWHSYRDVMIETSREGWGGKVGFDDTPAMLARLAPSRSHLGDPCIYCEMPHDHVAPGPCPALSPLPAMGSSND